MKKMYLLLTGLLSLSLVQAQLSRLSLIEASPGYSYEYMNSNLHSTGVFHSTNITGSSGTAGCIFSTDSLHDLQWCKKVTLDGEDKFLSFGNACIDSDHNIYQYFGYDSQYFIIKMDENGNLIWKKNIQSDIPMRMYEKNSFLYLAGTDFNTLEYIAVMKLDSDGNTIWEKKMALSIPASINELRVDDDGNVYLYGADEDDHGFDSWFYNIMILADGTEGYINKYRYEMGGYEPEIYFGIPAGDHKSLVAGEMYYWGIDTPFYSERVSFFGLTDENGLLSNVTVLDAPNDKFYIYEMEATQENTALLAIVHTNITSTSFNNLLLEVDFSGNILSSKIHTFDSLVVGGYLYSNNALGTINNDIFQILKKNLSPTYIYSSPKTLDGCRVYDYFMTGTHTFDMSIFPVTHDAVITDTSFNLVDADIVVTNEDFIRITETCASQIGIEENEISYELYPNPADAFMMLESGEEIDRFEVLTTEGKIVKNMVIHSNQFSIDISGLPKGVYFIRAFRGNLGTVQKFIKL